MDVACGMLFLILSNVKINSNNQKLRRRLYAITEALPTTRQIELIRKKEFVTTAFDPEDEIFVVHLVFFVSSNDVYLFYRVQIVSLKIDEVLITVPTKYSDFANIFSPGLAVELSEYMEMNDHVIELIDGK